MFHTRELYCIVTPLLCVALFVCCKGSQGGYAHASSEQLATACPAASDREVIVRFIGNMDKVVCYKAYSKDSKVFKMSGYMKREAVWGDQEKKKILAIKWDKEIFDMTARLFDGFLQARVGVDDTVEILHLMEYLCMDEACEAEHYTELARKTREFYKDPATDCREEFRKRMLEECGDIRSFRIYVLQLLSVFAEESGMSVSVDEGNKTLHLRHCSGEHRGRTSTSGVGGPGKWKLRVEMNRTYQSHADVQMLLEMLVEMMDIRIAEVDVLMWRPEDNVMVKQIIEKTLQTNLNVACCTVEPGAIHLHMQELKNHTTELDLSWCKGLDDSDWETIGKMSKLERLKMGFY